MNTEGQDSYYAGSSIVNNIRSASTPSPLNRRSAHNQRKGRPGRRNDCLGLVTGGRRTPAGGTLPPAPRRGTGADLKRRGHCLPLCCYFFFLRNPRSAGEP